MKKTLLIFTLIGLFNNCYAASIEVGFSPEGTGQELILKVIHSSKISLKIAAYSFTSFTIVKALIQAKKRGVDVELVADSRENSGYEHGASRSALNILVKNNIAVRLCNRYAIHHDKYIIADGNTVETGSFNYSKAANVSNSENVMVIWNEPNTAALYLKHWKSRYDLSEEYKPNY